MGSWDQIVGWAALVALLSAFTSGSRKIWRFVMERIQHTRAIRLRTAQAVERIEEIVPTVQSLEKSVNSLTATSQLQQQMLERLMPNGRNTENPGDLIARIAEHLGIIPPTQQGSEHE
jgi:hypothetical protein